MGSQYLRRDQVNSDCLTVNPAAERESNKERESIHIRRVEYERETKVQIKGERERNVTKVTKNKCVRHCYTPAGLLGLMFVLFCSFQPSRICIVLLCLDEAAESINLSIWSWSTKLFKLFPMLTELFPGRL